MLIQTAVMDAKGDNVRAAEAVEKLASAACQRSGLIIKIPARAKAPQLEAIECDLKLKLMKTVEQRQDQRRIVGAPLTIDEMLDLSVEDVGEGPGTVYNDDDAIVAEIERQQAIRSGEIVQVEVESDDENIGDGKSKLSTALRRWS